MRERTVRKHPQESPLALSIQRNHLSLNKEKLTRGRNISSANLSEVRALRSNLLYLTILALLLTPSFVGSAAILLCREFFIFPDPISYPQSSKIQIHPAIQNLQIHRESELLYLFCWFAHSCRSSCNLCFSYVGYNGNRILNASSAPFTGEGTRAHHAPLS